MLFKRKYYLQKIAPFIGKDLIKVITGQRRTGKSYFLRQIAEDLKETTPEKLQIYIDKERLEFDFIKTYEDLAKYVENLAKNQSAILFIDEVQEIKHFEKALRHLLNIGKWDIYISGSNADMLSGELATLLSGRYIAMEIFPLSYPEFLEFHNREDNPESFQKYLRYGGMPYLYNLALEDEPVFEYLRNVTNTILFKDVVAKYNVRDIEFLENLTRYIADNIGSLISAKRISDYLKSQRLKHNHNTVMEYLNHLANAFLIHRVKRYDIQGKRLLEIGEKDYFTDIGIRHSIGGYKQADIAKLFENVVYNFLKQHGMNVYVGKIRNKEVDFIAQTGDKFFYLQVTLSLASETVKERELGNLNAIKDNYPKIVVTGDEYVTGIQEGIEIWNIRKFLTAFNF